MKLFDKGYAAKKQGGQKKTSRSATLSKCDGSIQAWVEAV
jgi:hypothetical protein